MAKVVTSAGLAEFIETGKVDVIKDDRRSVAEKSAATAPPATEKPPVDDKGGAVKPAADAKVETPPEPEKPEPELTQEELDLPERARRAVNKRHKAWKEAVEEAAELERLAENQFNLRRLAEQRADATQRELETLKGRVEPPKVAAPAKQKPVHTDVWTAELIQALPEEKRAGVKAGARRFYDDEGQFKAFEFADAVATYAAEDAVARDRARQVEEAQRAAATAAEAEARTRVDKTRKKYADFDDVVKASTLETHSAVLQYLTTNENIGEIVYYFVKHPDYVERINKLNPLKAIAEIGKLELTFEKPKPDAGDTPAPVVVTPKAGAPPPITPLNSQGAGIVQTDPAKMNFKELRAYHRAREAASRR